MVAKQIMRVSLIANTMSSLSWINVMFTQPDGMVHSPVFVVTKNGQMLAYLLINFLDHRHRIEEE